MSRALPKLRRYAKGEICSGLNRIDKPIYYDTGKIVEFQTVKDSEEIFFSQILQQNIKHLAQASATSFVNDSFGELVHPFQFNEFSNSILCGTADISHVAANDAVWACIREMAYRPGEDVTSPVSANISAKDFNGLLELVSEET